MRAMLFASLLRVVARQLAQRFGGFHPGDAKLDQILKSARSGILRRFLTVSRLARRLLRLRSLQNRSLDGRPDHTHSVCIVKNSNKAEPLLCRTDGGTMNGMVMGRSSLGWRSF